MKTTKSTYTLIFWIAILFILSLNILLWLYVNQAEKRFADELKTRLLSTNRYISRLIDEELLAAIIPGQKNSLEYITVLQQLESIRRQDSLQSILLLTPDGNILVASPEILSIQKESSRQNNSFFNAASGGNFSTTNAEQVENEWFMSSYGPVTDLDGFVNAVLIIEAKAAYFSTMEQLRNSLAVFSLINLLVIILIAYFLFRFINRTLKYQGTLKDQEHLVQLGTMAATVAHEIRNPLSIIEGSNELIRKKYAKTDDEIFNYIPAETERLNQLIENFLTFSKTPAVHISEFLVKSLFDRMLVGIDSKSAIKIDIDQDLQSTQIRTDENLLEQAILNLLKNAISVSKDSAEIALSAYTRKSYVFIEVKDMGPGIDTAIENDIFKPFFTTREKGTGLGLAITKRIAELLGGSISFKSNNQGTAFLIKIPQEINPTEN